MCGIVGYVGNRKTVPFLLDSIQNLEHRGYDSVGVSITANRELIIKKAVGRVQNLRDKIANDPVLSVSGFSGIAHTRWATHGTPCERNAHPHTDCHGMFAVAHNGIVENFSEIKNSLQNKGYSFQTETDSEVIPNLIHYYFKGNIIKAVAESMKAIQGTLGIAVISIHSPNLVVAARRGSPIVLGLGQGENIVASDISSLVHTTHKAIYLKDDEIALVTPEKIEIVDIHHTSIPQNIVQISEENSTSSLDNHPHYMLKEIFEQPVAIKKTIQGRLNVSNGLVTFSETNFGSKEIVDLQRIIIAACGSSLYAGILGKYFFEDLANIPVEVAQAAEFRYRNPLITPDTLALLISQSGETADTLAAMREAKVKGSSAVAICNVIGSTLVQETERAIFLHAGAEIGVASTKAFTSQVVTLLMLALRFGRSRRLDSQACIHLVKEITKIPEYIERVLRGSENIKRIAKKWAHSKNLFYIGRGYLYPVALEGALKVKEIGYVHAEGYHAAELKHGSLALLDENFPVIALTNQVEDQEKIISNVRECMARKAPIILCALEDQTEGELSALSEDRIAIPRTSRFISPITTTVALQLFAYYVALERGNPIDKPRNLAKTVTVE